MKEDGLFEGGGKRKERQTDNCSGWAGSIQKQNTLESDTFAICQFAFHETFII